MGGYDYIAVRAPLLSHNGEKGVVRKGCLKRVGPGSVRPVAFLAIRLCAKSH
jgi:hypothetical protein